MSHAPPRILIVAGSDSGGGAGLQADLRTCAAHNVFGTTAVTAVTAQNTLGVKQAEALAPALVRAQIDAVLEDIGTDAVKIGMLASAPIAHAVADALLEHTVRNIVLDPVMVAKSGDPLLADDAVAVLRDRLLPLALVVTPNLPELARLTGASEPANETARIELARQLVRRGSEGMGPERGGPAVLVKGGHALDDRLVDLLVSADGVLARFEHPRQRTRSTHGTGCTLSSAIACRLARGDRLPAAVAGAIAYLQGAIAAAEPLGHGHGPVNHLWERAS